MLARYRLKNKHLFKIDNFKTFAFTLAEGSLNANMSADKRKTAFTLAEVLITLGIIGIVAAMTLPSVINHFQRKELETRFKKAYSELQQAAMMVQAKKDINLFEYAKISGSQAALDVLMAELNGAVPLKGSATFAAFKRNFYDPKLLDKKHNSGAYCDATNVYRTSGGRFYSMDDTPQENSLADPKICVDINGEKNPNAMGHDLFVFTVTKDGNIIPFKYKWTVWSTTIELADISTQCVYTTRGESAASCSYFALSDTNPHGNGSYWKDFLGYK